MSNSNSSAMKNHPLTDDPYHDTVKQILQQKYQHIHDIETELSKIKNQLAESQHALSEYKAGYEAARSRIKFMEESKFWKLRNVYAKVKNDSLKPARFSRKIGSIEAGITTDNTASSTAFKPLVSVIVPCYNHAEYLHQRLESIYSQSYKHIEVILLDDNSSDKSQEVLLSFKNRFPTQTRHYFNEKNSGNVFSQWKKGISHSRGELIWIAESDDYCDKDFLEKLVTKFSDESVMLAYAYSQFVNADGSNAPFSFDSYVSGLSETKWQQDYTQTAHKEVQEGLGMKNTIPNVSSAVFRNIPPQIFDYEQLKQFKVCGDWYFYLSLIRGGKIAYSRSTKNYYRFHPTNTSSNFQKNIQFVKEHELIAKYISSNYIVDPEVIQRHRQYVREVWDAQNPDSKSLFDSAYSVKEVEANRKDRRPNILMGIYSFTTGGGETVPIGLANELKMRGYSVTLFDCNMVPPNERTTRSQLMPSIPVVQREHSTDINSVLEDFGIEIAHTHHTTVDLILTKRRNMKMPHIVTTHGLYDLMPKDVLRDISPQLSTITKWVYVADKNLIPLKKIPGFTKSKSIKISNGVSPAASGHSVSRAQLGISRDAFVICLASRAIKEKGWREAIDAVKIANTLTTREIVLLLVGDGPIYDSLNQNELGKSIKALGFQNNVSSYFSIADLGLLPTMYRGESCPMVLIECLMAGKPFIATNLGEIKSMLTDTEGRVSGKILELDHSGNINVLAMAEIIADIANDSDELELMSANARLRKEYFNINNVAEKHVKLYAKLLNKIN